MKNTYRFFIPPESITGDAVHVTEREIVHQWLNVLRLRVGQHIAVLDGMGRGMIVELESLDKKQATARVVSEYAANGEPSVNVTMYVALTRGERFEWVLQKATELGAIRVVPLICERTQVEQSQTKRERWQRIIREAAEQSCRAVVPVFDEPQAFMDALKASRGAIFLSEGDETMPFKAAMAHQTNNISIWSGAEGGWSENEMVQAHEHGLLLTTLGHRILRAETAPIAALSAVMYERDEWK